MIKSITFQQLTNNLSITTKVPIETYIYIYQEFIFIHSDS